MSLDERGFDDTFASGFYAGWSAAFAPICTKCLMPIPEHTPDSWSEDGECIVGTLNGRYAS